MRAPEGFGTDCDRIAWWRALRVRGPNDRTLVAVLLALSTWMDPIGASCFPSQANIAQAAKVDEKTVQRALTRAVRLGWLCRWRVNVPGTTRHSAHYRATLPPDLPAVSLQEQPRQPAGSLSRGNRGRFERTTPSAGPNDPVSQSRTTPSADGGSTHIGSIGSNENGLREISGPRIDEVRARQSVLRLAADGFDAPTICGLLHRLEIGERQVIEWIREARQGRPILSLPISPLSLPKKPSLPPQAED